MATENDYNSFQICSESSCESESEIIKSAIDCVTPPPLADFNMAEYNTPSSQHRNRLSQPAKASTPFDAVGKSFNRTPFAQ